jgi:hypothetical protein
LARNSALLDHAQHHGCGAIVVENLDFTDTRATRRERLGRGARGKRLRRTVAGIPTRRFRIRLIGMATGRGIAVIGVDPHRSGRPPAAQGGRHYSMEASMLLASGNAA